jgi:hypothetical protein
MKARARFLGQGSSLLPFLFLVASLSGLAQAADNLGTLGSHPRWSVLEHYQETITRDDFTNLLQNVYCTHGMPSDLVSLGTDSARILTNREAQTFFTLRFASDRQAAKRVPRLWRPAGTMAAANSRKPLLGLKVALDPGHLGGRWAKMEERWFKIDDANPVQEGDLTLRVARVLASKLRALGATVSFVRNKLELVTSKRPDDFRDLAKKVLIRNGVPQPVDTVSEQGPEKEQTVRWQSEILFYRYSEIRRRAVLVNTKLHPDVVVCLHFNAEGWVIQISQP